MNDQKISIAPLDEEHVLSDCTLISEAAINDIDKVISTGPLIYIACKGKAVVLDNKDKYACILKKDNDIYSLNMQTLNGQLGISWSQEYHLCDGLLTITDRSTKNSMLQMKLYKEILDLVRRYGA